MSPKDRTAALLLAVTTFLVFWIQNTSGKIIAWLDMTFYFLPFRMLTSSLLKAGELPLWNPYIYCGQPLMANMQSAVYYPLNAFYYVLEPALAVRFATFFTYFIMSFSSYMFARRNKLSGASSFLFACLYSFTYYMTIKAVELADLAVMAWLPAVMYFIKKYSESKRPADLFFCAAALALSFLGGHPQVFLYAAMLAVAYFFFCCGFKPGTLSLVAVAAFALTAAQLLPTAEFAALSRRATPGGLGPYNGAAGGMSLSHILQAIFPFTGIYMETSVRFMNWMALIDIGILSLALMIFGIAGKSGGKERMFFLAVFTAAFIMSLLPSTPVYALLYEKTGLLRGIRYASKVNLLMLLAMCWFAAFGLEKFLNEAKENAVRLTAAFGVFCVSLVAVYAGLGIFKTVILRAYRVNFAPQISLEDFVEKAYYYEEFRSYFLFYIIIAVACFLALYIAASGRLKRKASAVMLVIAALFSGLAFNRGSFDLHAPISY
ncbi:MAG TPA: hypothetical protein P5511_07160, partial [Candidatus Goldiibacteriota bacterium]|nr:hypothetical protein [Candidatus Goldiibacteriota bacterium]